MAHRKESVQRSGQRGAHARDQAIPKARILGALFLAAISVLAYFPSIRGGFILDDDVLVTDNRLITSSDGLYRIWFTTEHTDYWPITNTSFWLEWRLWGRNPTGYHVSNLVLHIASALLIWTILSRLGIPGAWLAALLFAVFPVNVESVAWIAQRKNTLSMLFFLLSVLWYLKADASARRGWYWLSLLAFILAMLSKGSVAVLPLILLLLAWWQRGSVSKRDLARTAPFFLVAIALAAVNVWFQTHGTGETIRNVTWLQRLLGAGAVVWFYLYKALLPVNLSFIYPQWNIEISDWHWWVPLLAGVAVMALLVWKRNSPYGRPLLFAWLFFCVALAPVMGFADVAFMEISLVADHYQHIALIGVVALVAAGCAYCFQHTLGAARWAVSTAAIAIVTLLTFLSFQQSRIYNDPATLYHNTLEKNPGCWIAHNNLGTVLLDSGLAEDALEQFQQAVRAKPDNAEALANLAYTLSELGRKQEALAAAEQALSLNLHSAKIHYNLGSAYANTGQHQDAINQFQQAIQFDPNYADAYNNLGIVLCQIGRPSDAIETFEHALRLRPEDPFVHNNLGNALAALNRPGEAIAHFKEALRLKPDYIVALVNLADAYVQTDQISEAVRVAQQAVELSRAGGDSDEIARAVARLRKYQNQQAAGQGDSAPRGSEPERHRPATGQTP